MDGDVEINMDKIGNKGSEVKIDRNKNKNKNNKRNESNRRENDLDKLKGKDSCAGNHNHESMAKTNEIGDGNVKNKNNNEGIDSVDEEFED